MTAGDARAEILARLGHGLRGGAPGAEQRQGIVARLATPAATLIPSRAALDQAGRIVLFTRQAEAVQASVERLPGPAELPAAVAAYLRRHNLPMRLVMARDPLLTAAPFAASMIQVRYGPVVEADAVGLTVALAGIAETGTLLLASSTERPTMLAFLPETALVVLPSRQVLRAYEDAIAAWRATGEGLPRSLNFVTGPSRSGDIEQTLQLGAHGPRRLHILLIDEPAPAGDGASDAA